MTVKIIDGRVSSGQEDSTLLELLFIFIHHILWQSRTHTAVAETTFMTLSYSGYFRKHLFIFIYNYDKS